MVASARAGGGIAPHRLLHGPYIVHFCDPCGRRRHTQITTIATPAPHRSEISVTPQPPTRQPRGGSAGGGAVRYRSDRAGIPGSRLSSTRSPHLLHRHARRPMSTPRCANEPLCSSAISVSTATDTLEPRSPRPFALRYRTLPKRIRKRAATARHPHPRPRRDPASTDATRTPVLGATVRSLRCRNPARRASDGEAPEDGGRPTASSRASRRRCAPASLP